MPLSRPPQIILIMPTNEILPVVDRYDHVRAYLPSGVIHERELRHREVVIYLFDKKGCVLVQKRDGGVYDHSVAGHVGKHERYLVAAQREIKEELGLFVQKQDLLRVGKFYHRSFSERSQRYNNRFFTLYVLNQSVDKRTLRLDHREVETIETMTFEQIHRLFKGKSSHFKGGFPVSFKALIHASAKATSGLEILSSLVRRPRG